MIENLNHTTGTRSTLVLAGFKSTEFTAVEHNIPGLSINAAVQPTPFRQKPQPGDTPNFEPLRVTFIVDENLSNWLEMYNWIVSFGAPDNYTQYKGSGFIDASLIMYNSHNNQIMKFKFIDAIITSLSEIAFSTMEESTVYKYATVSIEYEQMIPEITNQ